MAGPRIIGTLMGDIQREKFAQVKYGLLFQELAEAAQVCAVYDATLRGPLRWINLLQSYHPDKIIWRERFYKNLPAFTMRSWQVSRRLKPWKGKADACLQVGVMFNSCADQSELPVIIYTDYTQALSTRAPGGWRSPFTRSQRKAWMDQEKRAYQQAVHICTRSHQVRKSVIKDYSIDPTRVTAVGGGVNFERLPDLQPQPAKDTIDILFIGKDFERKGGDLLLTAFQQARTVIPNLHLTMVTDGPIPASFDLDGVQVYPPSWDRDWISSLFRQADLFALPSRLETWGDVLLEAMAFGIPCVGVQGQAMDEIINHGYSGWLAEAENPESLAAGIMALAGDENFRLSCGQNARAAVEQSFTWGVVARRLVKIICELI